MFGDVFFCRSLPQQVSKIEKDYNPKEQKRRKTWRTWCSSFSYRRFSSLSGFVSIFSKQQHYVISCVSVYSTRYFAGVNVPVDCRIMSLWWRTGNSGLPPSLAPSILSNFIRFYSRFLHVCREINETVKRGGFLVGAHTHPKKKQKLNT